VKVVGGGHSWNDIACTPETLVTLDRMDRVLSVDRAARRITVEGGLRLKDLKERLAEHGLAMRNLGSIAEQSIAGATATGTHGTGIRLGNLSTQVAHVRLATADGRVLDLTPRDGDLFDAARLGLGALGIVTAVTLDCEDAFDLEETTYGLPFNEALARMQDLVEESAHVKFWWLPHTGWVQVYRFERTTKPRTRPTLQRRLDESDLTKSIFRALLWTGARLPAAVPLLNSLVRRSYFKTTTRVDRSDRVLNIAMPPVHREAEYAIPRERATEALRAMNERIERDRLKVNFVVETRFVAADSILMSPAQGRASCHITCCMYDSPSLRRYFAAFEEIMDRLEGRPHWGKEFTMRADRIRARLPGYDRFKAIRDELDPGRRFDNAFLGRVLA
jgi:FAD-linked oxidoreductase